MARVDEAELRRWRGLPAALLISRLAVHAKRDSTFVPIKGNGTERWHASIGGREYEFIADGPKFYDTRAERGGGGAVDFVMYLHRVDFRGAVALLRRLDV
ncbi:hypothetical protein [Paraburkholderia sp. RL17-337-BIB-A]|uniref:hypothetical protein n=1 Tax=Paraburkholderia sp. RL17-337-BIB-A TaxID=3031636 RepID=UPI0038BA8067